MRLIFFGFLGKGSDKLRCGSATSADNVDEPLFHKHLHFTGHLLSRLVVLSHGVGQSGIGIDADIERSACSQCSEIRQHLRCTKRTVEPHREDGIIGDAGQESLKGLSAQRASCKVADSHADHNGQLTSGFFHDLHRSVNGCFAVERVKDRLNDDGVDTSADQCLHFFAIGVEEFVIAKITRRWVADIRAHGAGLVGRPYRTAHKTWMSGTGIFIGTLSGDACTFISHLGTIGLKMIIGLRYTLRGESISGDDVGSGSQILPMDIHDHLWLGDIQHIVVALHLHAGVSVAATPEIGLAEPILLNHGSHGTVQHHKSLFYNLF